MNKKTVKKTPKSYTVSDLAASGALHCSERTIRRLIYAGKLRAVNIGAGEKNPIYLITEGEVARFLSRK